MGVTPVSERRERRVVSVLFADLVGFTSRSERLDVEDVEGFLQPYFQLLEAAVQSTGGVVAKFTGDGVMAMFGADVAHEDDPERAVRAGLAICEGIADLDDGVLNVRVGVTTGEVLVTHDAHGRMDAVGDVANTAARLESAAPVGRMLVDTHTYRSTELAILYDQSDGVVAKGKSGKIEAWIAVQARSIVPEQTRASDLPLVGREAECVMLRGALDRSLRDPATQLITVVGPPGIGKSRLVEDLGDYVEDVQELITWRRGRSLSYGEGIAFWALGEMIKLQAGILESDDGQVADEKLRVAVVNLIVVDEGDRDWVIRHLRPLVGLDRTVSAEANTAEAFAAWRRFFEAMAEEGPTVLVFEDIHWADDALLDFIDLLVSRAGAVPLLIVCTARPELFERRPAWGGGKPNASTISLTALSGEDTARLVAELLNQALLPVDVQQALLDRAGGNPLYAQEYVRMLQDRALLRRGEAGWSLEGEIDGLPESVHGIIAARLDTLSHDEKQLIHDAAVMGRTAWLGAVCALTPRPSASADDLLHALEQKQLVQRVRRPTITGETEFRFAHALTVEVAYAQIRRADRAQKHEAAAAWIERLAEGREDKAELLAHHYATALELRRQIGETPDDLLRRAASALAEAGRQSAALNAYTRAVGYFDAALDALPDDDPTRADLLYDRAVAQSRGGAVTDAELDQALEAQLAAQCWEGAARVEVLIAHRATREDGDLKRGLDHLDNASRYAQRVPYSHTASEVAHTRLRALLSEVGNEHDLVGLAREGLQRAEAAGDEVGAALLLSDLADARFEAGDLDGIDDAEKSADMLDRLSDRAAANAYNSLAWNYFNVGRLDDSLAALGRARDWAGRMGEPYLLAQVEGSGAEINYYAGSWQSARIITERYLDDPARFHAMAARNIRGRLALAAGDMDTARADANDNIEFGESADNHEFLCPGLALLAATERVAGDRAASERAITRYLEAWHAAGGSTPPTLAEVALVQIGDGSNDAIIGAALILDERVHWRAPILALAHGHYEEAVRMFEVIGSSPLTAEADFRAATRARAVGDDHSARHHARAARTFAERVGAGRMLVELDALQRSETA